MSRAIVPKRAGTAAYERALKMAECPRCHQPLVWSPRLPKLFVPRPEVVPDDPEQTETNRRNYLATCDWMVTLVTECCGLEWTMKPELVTFQSRLSEDPHVV